MYLDSGNAKYNAEAANAHDILLTLVQSEVTVEEKRKVVTERVQDCATVLSSARPSVEVEFVLEEVSALESSHADVAKQGYKAAGQIVIGALKSPVRVACVAS